MASIKKRTLANGKVVYDVRYRTPDGKARCETKPTFEIADRRVHEVETAKDRGLWIDPRAGLVLFGDYGDEWIKHRRCGPVRSRPTSR